jgi:hypothetical protein
VYAKYFNYTADDILSVAEAQYLKLFEKGQWSGATTKGQDSTFAAQQWTSARFSKCHNCGKPGCCVDICPNPRDDDKVKSNRKLFMDSKKAKGGGGGGGHQKSRGKKKWRKPEPSEDGKRHIDGKHMYCHYRSGKWKVVDDTPAQIAASKKSATESAAKVSATALLVEAAEGDHATGLSAALPLPNSRPSQDKLKAANLVKLVLEHPNLDMQSESLTTIDGG